MSGNFNGVGMIVPINDVTSSVYAKYITQYGPDFCTRRDNVEYGFKFKNQSLNSISENPDNAHCPALCEDVMFDVAVAMAKDIKSGNEEIQACVYDSNALLTRTYDISKDEIVCRTENAKSINTTIRNVREEMRQRAFDGEFSEDTRPYLSDEEASDMLLAEQESKDYND